MTKPIDGTPPQEAARGAKTRVQVLRMRSQAAKRARRAKKRSLHQRRAGVPLAGPDAPCGESAGATLPAAGGSR